MGMYMYVSEQDRTDKRRVTDDGVNEEFQEALKHDPSLMIEEIRTVRVRRRWLKREELVTVYYNLYHETPARDGSASQARYQSSGSGDKRVVIAYLHGIINGCAHREIRMSE